MESELFRDLSSRDTVRLTDIDTGKHMDVPLEFVSKGLEESITNKTFKSGPYFDDSLIGLIDERIEFALEKFKIRRFISTDNDSKLRDCTNNVEWTHE